MTRIVFIIFIAAIAFAATLHREPAKVQDRMTAGDALRYCNTYYAWRSAQAGGIPAIDNLCFFSLPMQP